MSKIKGFLLALAFACALFVPMEAEAADDGRKPIMSFIENGQYMFMYDDLSIELLTEDREATTQYRYKTIGFMLTRQYSTLSDSSSSYWHHKSDNGKYICYEDFKDENGNKQWVEFALRSANVEVETTSLRGYQYNIWRVPGDKVKEIIGGMYPDWLEALEEVVRVTQEKDFMSIHMAEAMKMDSIMTVVHRVNDKDYIKGFIEDAGTGRVIASCLTYWNDDSRRCSNCSSDAMFTTSLYEGYPAGDVNRMGLNIRKNERICWYCTPHYQGRNYKDLPDYMLQIR